MKRRLRGPSPALVVSSIALCVALGGTAYAATSLPRNSVGTRQLKDNAVTAAKIRDGAVSARKLNTNGLTVPNALFALSANAAQVAHTADSASFATNATHANGATSAINATNATHATNATSATTAATANALAGVEIVSGPLSPLPAGQADQTVTCPTGMVAIAGGQTNNSSDTSVEENSVQIKTTIATDDSVEVVVNNTGSNPWSWNAYAVCIHGSESSSP